MTLSLVGLGPGSGPAAPDARLNSAANSRSFGSLQSAAPTTCWSDLAVRRDEVRLGVPVVPKTARRRALRVQRDGQARDPALLQPARPRRSSPRPRRRRGTRRSRSAFVSLTNFTRLGHLLAAGRAPRRPEVDDEALAGPRREVAARRPRARPARGAGPAGTAIFAAGPRASACGPRVVGARPSREREDGADGDRDAEGDGLGRSRNSLMRRRLLRPGSATRGRRAARRSARSADACVSVTHSARMPRRESAQS